MSDEFDYWLARLIDVETFTNWLFMTVQSFEDKKAIGKGSAEKTFMQGWEDVGRRDNEATNPWFVDLVSALIKLAQKNNGPHDQTKFDTLLDIVQLAEKKSAKYRKALQGDMSLEDYRKTLKNAKLNKLSLADVVKT
jgi:hypothetical protein